MIGLQSLPASPRLQPFIRAFAQRDLHPSDHNLIQPVPASLENILQFEFFDSLRIRDPSGNLASADRCAIVGPHTRPDFHVHFSGRTSPLPSSSSPRHVAALSHSQS